MKSTTNDRKTFFTLLEVILCCKNFINYITKKWSQQYSNVLSIYLNLLIIRIFILFLYCKLCYNY